MNAAELYNTMTSDGYFYRCGYCGQPTDKNGMPLNIEVCKLLTDENLNNAELVQGYCCEPQDNYIVVTRDMAIDACDLSLEGERWKW